MKKRNPVAVLLFGLITLGLYSWYWAVKTKGEMNTQGEHIPTAWIWLIPFVGGLYWYWKYSEGVDHVTKGKLGTVLAFVVLIFLGVIGQAIVQASLNDVAAAPAGAAPAAGPVPPVPAAAPTAVPVTSAPEAAPAPAPTDTTPPATPPAV